MSNVEFTLADGVAEIVLNRPEKRNALDPPMVAAILDRLGDAERGGARAVILHGVGKGFCAGRDLGDADPRQEDATEIIRTLFNPMVRRVVDFPLPTFAAVQGPCLGAGLGLALACDVVYAADDARFGSPFARLGAVPDSGAHALFVARLGTHRALELIYSGQLISGPEAAALGLVNRSVGRSVLLERVRALAAQVANGPTAAFAGSKRLVRRIEAEGLSLDSVLEAEAVLQGEMSKTADYVEGISAFQEKRSPRFQGR